MAISAVSSSTRALTLSTLAFTLCFAVWMIFAIIGLQIREELQLSETQFGLLIGMPVLTGSLIRVLLGIWTDQLGGRIVYTLTMLSAALATFLLSFAKTYPQFLLAALGVGLAGGTFAVGVAYVSRFFPAERQGTALGIFGVGNVGAALTKFGAPFLLIAYGWQGVAQIYAAVLVVTALLFWVLSEDDPSREMAVRRSFREELAVLADIRVLRFSLYYFFVFGGFVALALWLPRYLIGVYQLDVATAGMIGAAYSLPGSVFRAWGGSLSDKYGARVIMTWTFVVSTLATLTLALPLGLGTEAFIAIVFVLGLFMALGKAAVFKYIPLYYPNNVGGVGGMVGMVGGLGGFVLPLLFGWLRDVTGDWASCFAALFLVSLICLLWMRLVLRRLPNVQPA